MASKNTKAAKAPAAKVTTKPAAKLATPVVAEPARKGWAALGTVDKAAKLEWLVTKCPKRPGTSSGERAARYWNKPTVGAYLEAGGTRLDLSWDAGHAFVKVAQ